MSRWASMALTSQIPPPTIQNEKYRKKDVASAPIALIFLVVRRRIAVVHAHTIVGSTRRRKMIGRVGELRKS
jgi:hypothetical protein